MKLRLVKVIANKMRGFERRNFIVTDADGEILYAYETEQEALEVIKHWA
jgi:hypothetical protein